MFLKGEVALGPNGGPSNFCNFVQKSHEVNKIDIFFRIAWKRKAPKFCFVTFLLWKDLVHVKSAPVLGQKNLKCHIAIEGNAKVANQMTWRTKVHVYIFYKYLNFSAGVTMRT